MKLSMNKTNAFSSKIIAFINHFLCFKRLHYLVEIESIFVLIGTGIEAQMPSSTSMHHRRTSRSTETAMNDGFSRLEEALMGAASLLDGAERVKNPVHIEYTLCFEVF